MRERAQASIETIALTAAAVALATALLFGVVRLAPPLASALASAVSGAFAAGTPTAPELDALERALLDGATSPDADGPTLLDLRTHLRARLDAAHADAAFAAILRPLVARTLAEHSVNAQPDVIDVVDRASEDAWVRAQFYPDRLQRLAGIAIGFASTPGALFSLAEDLGLTAEERADAIAPGHAAGDIVASFGYGIRQIVLRRTVGNGLAVVADGGTARGGVRR